VESFLKQSVSAEAEFWEAPAFDIADQHILVIGGSSGLGRHFARFLASDGAKVALAARRAAAIRACSPKLVRRQHCTRARTGSRAVCC
jgi:NAD(P)-dependent dehydrogenase (short-subunit alcohol dehydrogenase family)